MAGGLQKNRLNMKPAALPQWVGHVTIACHSQHPRNPDPTRPLAISHDVWCHGYKWPADGWGLVQETMSL